VDHWGFVGLAYGVALLVFSGYLVFLKGRLREAGDELSALERDGGGRAR
jgi:hypothetical protein